ncbi:recQ-mediated genome instability protein 1 [Cololabis saira]|uniref:recQ-mediated genome instability protein 1 n=1 Tax=Cololabis saira TaxID=129043 RepID=UPI002AD49FA0|nr:recQ-mediated genome instability protein 1 [Cololabis saira]
MAAQTPPVVNATQAWLRSTWHIQVPFTWLEACVEWLQEEAGGAARLSQQQINQQVLDQWLLTDLRDLDYPVLPEGLAQAQKTELSGIFCVQVDSMLNVSQPAYGQLQKCRGTDCTNDEVSAVTQATQRPWEAKSTRMLLLQVTDGVQSLEAMEYQSIPALSSELRPGAKLQLQGQIVCRLGVLLLWPSNVKILGGEVEDLVERNNQGRVLCRTLGLPEEQQQVGDEAPSQPQHGNQEMEDEELDDAELIASLEAQGEAEMVSSAVDSGYGTMQETYTPSSSVRSHLSSRSDTSNSSQRGSLPQTNRAGSVQGHHNSGNEEEPDLVEVLPIDVVRQDIHDHNMADQDFPDEDFDDLPLDELDGLIFQEGENVTVDSDSGHRGTHNNNRITQNLHNIVKGDKPQTAQLKLCNSGASVERFGSSSSRSGAQKRDYQGGIRGVSATLTATSKSSLSSAILEPSRELQYTTNDESSFLAEDMDCVSSEVEASGGQTETAGGMAQFVVEKGPGKCRDSATSKIETLDSSYRFITNSSKSTPATTSTTCVDRVSSEQDPQSDSTVPPVTLTSPPFSYLCLLEELVSKPHTSEIRVKAFIVTLLGKLGSNNGVWSVSATISDGTGYLDVELSNEVLMNLLGFSVAQKGAMKRDPARRAELQAGMRRCQEELVDMCCIMTVVVEPGGRKAVVAKADPVNERVLQELEQRVKERKR